MIYSKIDTNKWRSTVIKKLMSFCEKSPVLLSVKTGIDEGREGVYIIHKNTEQQYFFEYDYEKEPQVFIHDIKEFLVQRHYPLLMESICEAHELTKEELALQLESGKKIDELQTHEMRVAATKLWRIDKVILWRDIAILEQLDKETGERKQQKKQRYKYNGSLFLFMRNYRSGAFKTLEEAGTEFFKNASLISEVNATNHPKE